MCGDTFDLLVFDRGLHCPICVKYLMALELLAPEFVGRGVQVVAISTSRGKTSIGIEVPTLFSESGVFIVRPDGTLYCGAVQTMPFARPHFQDLLGAIDFAVAKDYPARGEYTGAV